MGKARYRWIGSTILVSALASACAPDRSSVDNSPEIAQAEPVDEISSEPTGEPDGLMVYAQRAREAEAREDWEAARDEYLAALELEPNHPILLFRAARFESRLGETEEAIGRLERVADLGATGEVDADPFFDDLRDREEFQRVAKRLAENGRPHEPADIVLTFDDAELWPEGIATDAATGDIYVGSFHRKKVVRISADGRVEDFGTTASDDLQSVVGIWVDSDRRRFWAATGNEPSPEVPPEPGEVVQYDIESGDLIGRYPGPDDGRPQLINDVTVGPDGTAYVTESLEGIRSSFTRVSPDWLSSTGSPSATTARHSTSHTSRVLPLSTCRPANPSV